MSVDRTSKLIAIIDDDEAMQDSLRDLMEAAGLVAQCFGSAEEFLESDLHTRAACLIVDIRMPKMSGLQLQARLKEEECNIPIIFITAHGDARMRIRAMREGAVEFLAKPFDHHLLLKRSVQHLICERPRLSQSRGELKCRGVCGKLCNSYVPCGGSGRAYVRADHRQ